MPIHSILAPLRGVAICSGPPVGGWLNMHSYEESSCFAIKFSVVQKLSIEPCDEERLLRYLIDCQRLQPGTSPSGQITRQMRTNNSASSMVLSG